MKKNLIILVFSFFVLNVISQNLLINPDFESWSNGKPMGWNITNSTYVSQNKLTLSTGLSSIKTDLLQINKNVTLTQNIAISAGKTYRLSVSYFVERGDGKDANISCYFKNSSNTAIPLSLEDSILLKGPGGNAAYFVSEIGVWKTYTCDIVAPAAATIFVFSVRSSAYSVVYWDNFSFSVNSQPTISVSQTELSGFTYTPGNGPSVEKHFTVKGSNLTEKLTVEAPSNFEISNLSGSSFSPKTSIELSQTNGLVNSTEIYVRLKSGLSTNTYTGNIIVSSIGVPSQTLLLNGAVGLPPSSINTSISSLTGFSYVEGSGPSIIKNFTISGSGLTNGITISAPDNYEISILAGTSFVGTKTFTISHSNGIISDTKIYVRLKSGLVADVYNGEVLLTTNGRTNTVSLAGAVNDIPQLYVSTNSLSGFRYVPGNGPSNEGSFSISGKGMTSALVISAPTNFEISTESGTNFNPNSQLIIPQSEGFIDTMTIYVRLKANLAEGSYSGNISLQTSNGIYKSVSLSAMVSVPQEITLSTTSLSGFAYDFGAGPSTQQQFTVSAKGLSAMLLITAPDNFEISFEGSSQFTGDKLLVLPAPNGTVAITTIYVRLIAGLSVSEGYSNELIVKSADEISKSIVLNGVVNALPLINISKNSLTEFSYPYGAGPSDEQMFTIEGANLISDIIINAPNGYEMSLFSGVDFYGENSIVLYENNSAVLQTNIFVRLKSNLAVNSYDGSIEVLADKISTKYVSLSGDVLLNTGASYANTKQIEVVTVSNKIILTGVGVNQKIQLFSLNGILIDELTSKDSKCVFSNLNHAVYFVKIESNVYKVVI